MRDPERIHVFLQRLESVWQQVPDWRFGQLMCNTLGYAGRDPFFVEDDDMISAIEQSLGKICRSSVVNNHIEDALRPDGYMFGEEKENAD